MNSSPRNQLYKATVLTFEGLGFILPSSELNDDQKEAPVDARVEVAFRGALTGRLVLSVAGGILPEVVANMLGDEDDADDAANLDALGELANVICGNVLSEIAGPAETFVLTPPAPLRPGEGVPAARIEVGIGSGRADVTLYLEECTTGGPEERAA